MLPPDGFATVEIIEAFALPDADGLCPEDAVNGGHSEAQLPVHTTFPPFSGVNAYSVRPCALTSTLPKPEIIRVERAPVVAGALVAGVDDVAAEVDLLELGLLLPHAAAIKASGRSNRAGVLTGASFGVDASQGAERTPRCIKTTL